MITVYKIINQINKKEYFGITRNLTLRWRGHRFSSKTKRTPLYTAIRKYGLDNFKIVPLVYCGTWEYACEIEMKLIQANPDSYNLAPGGNGGFVVPNDRKEEWILKLKRARKGATPFLGRKHSEETKKVCGEYGKYRWDLYGRYDSKEILKLGFTEANKKFGISKTHYYRLRNKSNGLV